jgi:hypothetical protein
VAPWLITTPAWATVALRVATASVRVVGDPAAVTFAATWVAGCALALLLVLRARATGRPDRVQPSAPSPSGSVGPLSGR